jgi:hypothetical protein
MLIVAVLILSLASCGTSYNTYSYKSDGSDIINPKNSSDKYRMINADSLELVTKSGFVELYLDKVSGGIAVKDTSVSEFWYSLPDQPGVKGACVLGLEVSKDGKLYRLNSQDNSAAFKAFKYEKQSKGVTVKYNISDSKDKPQISVPIAVTYTLQDGSLSVDISCKDLNKNESAKVESIELLKYFGATKEADEKDFLLVPDGGGALIHTGKETNKSKTYNFRVYGSDPSLGNQDVKPAIAPLFGNKKGSLAYGAIIMSGDSLATISATKASKNQYNTIGAKFDIIPAKESVSDGTVSKTVSSESYTGDITVYYRFLSSANATYSKMASACREQLIRGGVLSTKYIDEDKTPPVNLTLIGEAKKGTLFNKNMLTTIVQAQDIAERLKAKGVNSLNVRYTGMLEGGLGQTNLKNSRMLRRLGSKKELNEFYDYMATQGFGLFMDINILTASGPTAKAKGIDNKSSTVNIDNHLFDYLDFKSYKRKLTNASKIEDDILAFSNKMRNASITGYCINDAGHILYSDFRDEYIGREEAKNIIAQQIILLSSNRSTMAVNGNFYTLKNVEILTNMELKTAYEESSSYKSIPFIPMILHGMIDYSGKPLNLSEDYNKSLLISIEYGALPAFEWSYEAIESDDGKASIYYETWLNAAAKAYEDYEALFSTLRNARMTDHYEVQKDLMCTVYDNETFVYVNYSKEDVVYNSLKIKANSFLRVN